MAPMAGKVGVTVMAAGSAAGAPSLLALYRMGLLLVVAASPLGAWQNVLLAGLTLPKLLIPSIFLLLLATHLPRLRLHPHTAVFAVFVVMTMPSLLRSDAFFPLFITFLGYLLLFQLTRNCLRTAQHLRSLVRAYFIGIVAIAGVSALALLGYDVGASIGRPMVQLWLGWPLLHGTEENPNAFATLFVPGIPAALYFLLTASGRTKRLLYLAALTLLVTIAVITGGRSAFMGALLASAIMLFVRRRFSVRRAMLMLGGLAAGIVLVLSAHEIAADLMVGASLGEPGLLKNKEMSAGYRLGALKPLFDAFLESPLIGIGYGQTYSWTQGSSFGQRVGSHNIVLGIGIEYGVTALLAFLAGIALCVGAMVTAVKREPNTPDRLVHAYFLGTLAGLLFHGLFHEIYVNFLLWFVMACGEATRRAAGVAHNYALRRGATFSIGLDGEKCNDRVDRSAPSPIPDVAPSLRSAGDKRRRP